MTLNEAIRDIQENETLSAEARNALHGATAGHPWSEAQSLDERKLKVRYAIAGRGVHAQRIYNVERATA